MELMDELGERVGEADCLDERAGGLTYGESVLSPRCGAGVGIAVEAGGLGGLF